MRVLLVETAQQQTRHSDHSGRNPVTECESQVAVGGAAAEAQHTAPAWNVRRHHQLRGVFAAAIGLHGEL